jgi:hypothetical protein
MATFIAVEFSLAGLPARTPYGVAIVYIEILSPLIHGYIIVPVAGDAAELSIFVKGIPTPGIGYQAEEVFVAQVIDPGPGSAWVSNDVFTSFIIEMSVVHRLLYK